MAVAANRIRLYRQGLFLLLVLTSAGPWLRAQLSTEDHLAEPGFWPTQAGVSRKDYVGPAACAPCHAAKFASQTKTPMARTVAHANSAEILHTHPELSFFVGVYRYLIKSDREHS